MDWLWIIVMVGGFAWLAWWAYRSDPHWVAKDGKAFTCRTQRLGDHFLPDGRWHNARAFVDGSHLIVRPRGIFRSGKPSAHVELIKKTEDPPPRFVVYLVDGGGVNGHEYFALRIPANSRAVPQMDALIVPRRTS